jgi:hypothetical protein
LSPKTAPVAVLLGIKDEEEIELLLLIDIYHEVEALLIYIFIPVPVFIIPVPVFVFPALQDVSLCRLMFLLENKTIGTKIS